MIHLISIVAIAIGLSMDAFSLAILYGTLDFSKRKTLYLALSVGVFHFFMPLLGNLIGLFILNILPINPNTLVGIIFFIISIQMILSLFKKEEVVDLHGLIAILLFAFTVSLDSFSVGIGLSAVCNNKILAVMIFSIVSFLFTFIGISIGSKLTEKFGKISTLIGSTILLLLSFCYLFLYNS
jgi:putative Mn2+ efflux pump MntP